MKPLKFSNKQTILIIGAGWSGLASAVTLVEHGYRVCLLESARQVGGRARSIILDHRFADRAIDNGQHIMLGAYHYTRALLKTIGQKEAEVLEQKKLELTMFSSEKNIIHFKAPLLPAPLHLLYALMTLSGLSLKTRWLAIKFALSLARSHYDLPQDISVSTLLEQHKQPAEIITTLWEPLCLAIMNTPISYASARVFLNVLKDSFSRTRQDSDLLFFKHDLTQFFCAPAVNFIQANDSQIHCTQRVVSLQLIDNVTNTSEYQFQVNTQKNSFFGQKMILATPAHVSEKLLNNIVNKDSLRLETLLQPDNASLNFTYEPICTVYMQYPEHIKLPERMIGFVNTTAQWAIDRSLNQQPGLIAVVISGPGKHTQMTHETLAKIIHKELSSSIANLPKPLYYKIITDKKATFRCHVNIQHRRPVNKTRIPGLFLAGDYTDTHYPSTLEGAIKSGVLAARQAMSSFK